MTYGVQSWKEYKTNLTTWQKTIIASRASTGVELDLNNSQSKRSSSLYLVTYSQIAMFPVTSRLGHMRLFISVVGKNLALPVLHALTGADNTGSFSGKGIPTCWKEFEEANESILRSLANPVGKDEKPDEETLDGIE